MSRQRCAPPTCSAASAIGREIERRARAPASLRPLRRAARRSGRARSSSLISAMRAGLVHRRQQRGARRPARRPGTANRLMPSSPLRARRRAATSRRSARVAVEHEGLHAVEHEAVAARARRRRDRRRRPSGRSLRCRRASPSCAPAAIAGQQLLLLRLARDGERARSPRGTTVEKKGEQSSASPISSSSTTSST